MILRAFLLALGQIFDRRFLRVLLLGLGLSTALLAAVYAAFLWLAFRFIPDRIDIPWFGETTRLHELLGAGSLLLMVGLSVFLMTPVAALFAGLFTDDIAAATEARHYPALRPAPRTRLGDSLVAALNFLGVMIAVNLVALLFYGLAGPFAPLLFWAVNGWLLGREYFISAAMRRIGPDAARSLYRANRVRLWLAGALMAAPLSLPFVNLLIPVLGAATFTHLFHALTERRTA